MHNYQAVDELYIRSQELMMLSTRKTNPQAAALLHETPNAEMIDKMSETSQSDCGASPDGKSCLTTTGRGHFSVSTLGFGLGRGGEVCCPSEWFS